MIHNIENRYASLIEEIKEHLLLSYPHEQSIGLHDGKASILLFLLYYKKHIAHSKTEAIDAILLSFQQEVEDKITQLFIDNRSTFGYGVAGLVWLYNHIIEHQLHEAPNLFEVSDELFAIHYVQALKALEDNFYDLFDGGIGFFMPILQYCNEEIKNNFTKGFIQSLAKIGISGNANTVGWLYYNQKKSQYYYDLGLAHGMTSILAILCKIVESGNSEDTQNIAKLLLERGCNFLTENQCKEKGKSYFPYSTDKEVPMEYSRMAWCYGDMGIGITLFRAGRCLKNDKLIDFANEVMLHATQRMELKPNLIFDPCFCHGTVGIAHIFNRMHFYTNDTVFNSAANYWFDKTIDIYETGIIEYFVKKHRITDEKYYEKWKMGNDILGGIGGIGLSLISKLCPNAHTWDECLLLS